MDNLFDKILSIVDTDEVSSKDDFDLFIDNLTNHPAPLREVCAYKLDEIYKDEYLDDNNLNIILNAVIDINPNVSRCVCLLIKNHTLLQKSLCAKLILRINDTLKLIPDNERNQSNKSHAKNKLLFSLYWLMEALFYSYGDEYQTQALEIIKVTFNFSDYTIREKAAQLLTKVKNPPDDLIKSIKQDKNFYVNFYSKFI